MWLCFGLGLLLMFCFVFKNVLDQCLGFSRVKSRCGDKKMCMYISFISPMWNIKCLEFCSLLKEKCVYGKHIIAHVYVLNV